MDQTLVTLIGSLGFPIVMCLLMYKQNLKMTDVISELKDAITVLTERITSKDDQKPDH